MMIEIIKKIIRGVILSIRRTDIKINSFHIGYNFLPGRGCIIEREAVIANNVILGKCCTISKRVILENNVTIGDYSAVNIGTMISQRTKVGNFSSIGNNCMIGNGNHAIDYFSTSQLLYGKNNILGVKTSFDGFTKTVTICNDVWIGNNAILMAGVTVGDGAVIGSGAVVTKNVEPYSIVVGNPAKLLRYRFDDDKIKFLLKHNLWENYSNHLSTIKKLIEQQENWECF